MAKTKPFDDHLEEYEEWFKENEGYYKSELEAVRIAMGDPYGFVEVGVGSGLFASPLGIRMGVEPSHRMAELAKRRGIEVTEGTGEDLPLEDESVNGILMVTTICFLDDPERALGECYRVLKKGGKVVIGFVDRESPIGREYLKLKEESAFYRDAIFYSSREVMGMLERTGFKDISAIQTLFTERGPRDIHPVREGFGEGSFVVITGIKK